MYLSDNLTVSICLYVSWRQKYKEKGKPKSFPPFLILRQVPEILVILLLRGQNHRRQRPQPPAQHRRATIAVLSPVEGLVFFVVVVPLLPAAAVVLYAVAAVVSGTIRRNGRLTHSHLGIIPPAVPMEKMLMPLMVMVPSSL